MARFGVAFVIPMLSLLLDGAVGASVTAVETVVRREAKSPRVLDRVSMTPTGELLQAKPAAKKTVPKTLETVSHQQPKDLEGGKVAHKQPKDLAGGTFKFQDEMTDAEKAKLALDFCDYDFPLGKEGTNDCKETTGGTKHELIMSTSMCIQAATESGATTSHDNFVIDAAWQYKRPEGCFQQQCSEAGVDPASGAQGMCYFFNGNGGTPGSNGETIVGAPVCHRKRYWNYTTPDTDTGDAGCSAGYELIAVEEHCRQAQNCLGMAPGDQFRIGMRNASRHLDYPYGCFINKQDHKVYINQKSRMGKGTSITGTLICRVAVSSRDATSYNHPADSSTAAPTLAPA